VLIEYGLDDVGVAESSQSPFGRCWLLRRGGIASNRGGAASQTGSVITWFVAADAALDFAGHEMREASHSLDGLAVGVNRHEV